MSLRNFMKSRRKVVRALVWLVLAPAILLGAAVHGLLQESWNHLFRFLALIYLDIARNKGETLRNVGLPSAAFIGVILGAWRIGVLNRQSATALRQAEAAERGAPRWAIREKRGIDEQFSTCLANWRYCRVGTSGEGLSGGLPC